MRGASWLGIGAALTIVAAPASARSLAAAPRGNPVAFFSPDDYPPEALRLTQQGRVVAKLWIDASGKVVSCTVTASSGSPALDQRTCEIALTRMVYEPARDARGRPVAASVELPINWRLPTPGPGSFTAAVPFVAVMEQVVDASGQRRSCTFRVNGAEQPDATGACSGGRTEIDEVLAEVPTSFRGHALVVYSETIQDYSGSPPAIRLDETDLTVVARISVHFTISTAGQVSNCRVEGGAEAQAWLRSIPCNGELTFRGAAGAAPTQPIEATWTAVQAVRLLPEPGGI